MCSEIEPLLESLFTSDSHSNLKNIDQIKVNN